MSALEDRSLAAMAANEQDGFDRLLEAQTTKPTKRARVDWPVARIDRTWTVVPPDIRREMRDARTFLRCYRKLKRKNVASTDAIQVPVQEYFLFGGPHPPCTFSEWFPYIVLDLDAATYGKAIDLFAMMWVHSDIDVSEEWIVDALAGFVPSPLDFRQQRTVGLREFLKAVDRICAR